MDIAEAAKKLFNYSFIARSRSRSRDPKQSARREREREGERERRPAIRPSSSAGERTGRGGRHSLHQSHKNLNPHHRESPPYSSNATGWCASRASAPSSPYPPVPPSPSDGAAASGGNSNTRHHHHQQQQQQPQLRLQREMQQQQPPPPLPPLPFASHSPSPAIPTPPMQRPATSACHLTRSSQSPSPTPYAPSSRLSNAPFNTMTSSAEEPPPTPRPPTSRSRLPVGYHNSPVINGNGVTVSIALAEPVMFLQGASNNVERQGFLGRKVALVRGCLRVKVTKPTKIKKIYLTFKGECSVALLTYPGQVNSPHTYDRNKFLNHTWTFFNASFPNIDQGTNYADHIITNINRPAAASPSPPPAAAARPRSSSKHSSLPLFSRLSSSSRKHVNSEDHSLSLQNTDRSRSVPKGDHHMSFGGGRGYKLFEEGEYHYNFEMPIDSTMPETFKTHAGEARVRYDLEAIVERAGAFRPNLWGQVEVPVVRALPESSLENVEPIAIIRNWESKLRYEIMVSGKSFAMGSRVPIGFKFTPLDKVAVQRIRIFVTEEYTLYSSNRAIKQRQERKRILLMEKKAGCRSSSVYPGSTVRVITGGGLPVDQQMQDQGQADEESSSSEFITNGTNLLGDLQGETDNMGCGPTEMEFHMQLPICQMMHKKPPSEQIHTDTHTPMIEVSHTIRIVMRLSTPGPNKRRHFEISIESPFHIRSCLTSTSNTSLPAYETPDPAGNSADQPYEVRPLVNPECNCRNALEDQLRELDGTVSLPPRPTLRLEPTVTGQSTSAAGHAVGAAGLNIPAAGGLVAEPLYFEGQRSAHEQALRQRRPLTAGAAPRPLHLIRAPSFAPPRFEDLSPTQPEQAMSPPPDYSSIVNSDDPIGDYYSRFRMFLDSAGAGQNEQENEQAHVDNTRPDAHAPSDTTPEGRGHGSMDVPRDLPRLRPSEELGIAISTEPTGMDAGSGSQEAHPGSDSDRNNEIPQQETILSSGNGEETPTQSKDEINYPESGLDMLAHAFGDDNHGYHHGH